MPLLILSLALFVALHSIPAVPAIRTVLVARLGRPLYFTLYSLVSLATLALLFGAALSLDYVELWAFAPWQAHVTLLLAPIGLFFVTAGLISPNPGSISLSADTERRGAIVAVTRHPVLVGFALWALGHLIANGELKFLVLFGGFALFALGAIPMQDRRARRRLGEPAWQAFRAETALLPFGALASGRARFRPDRAFLLALVLAAVLVWLLLAGGHAALFGVDPLAVIG